MGITIQTGITDGTHGITPSNTGITQFTGISATGGAPPVVAADYVAEDGVSPYVTENGADNYVTEA